MRWARLLLGLGLGALLYQPVLAAPPPPASARPLVSIVIDDLGQNLARDRQVLELSPAIALAIIPDTPHAAELAREAHKLGRTVMLHMPMDPAGGEFAWRPELSQEERARRLDAALARVPYAQGLNNHEGSRMTADRPAMAWLAAELQRRHLFLLDSRTSAATVAAAEAQKIGLASLSRDVFLDDDPSEAAVMEQMQRGLKLARKQGTVVMIGHPKPATLAVLRRVLPGLKAQGFELVQPSLMIGERANRAMQGHGRDGTYR
ncbi:divergent polysaccharide deacetylase family protein [Pseudomonas nitroreducens]|uniref:divergent polysaccharide deacetylase family protein n=1 Tax=Pseudomonas nitroreducens TaxID=46680 RepID=UPI00351D509E